LIKGCIGKLVEHRHLLFKEAQEAMKEIMSGKATDSQIAAILTALRMKGETADEIAALSTTMKEVCCSIHPEIDGRLVDIVGTGGDKVKTFNISTTAAIVVAGAGIAVAKHGNRSFTSLSGSADVLEQFGFNLNITPDVVERAIKDIGIGFMYAPVFHPAMKYAMSPRRDIGIRTIFNVLGPLTNPANANCQVLGVYSDHLISPLTQALKKLGCEEAMVVHGLDGLDEISTIGKTVIGWLKKDEVHTFEITPQELGINQTKPQEIMGLTPEENAKVSFDIITGNSKVNNAKNEIVLVNAAAGIIVGGKAGDFEKGIELAKQSIDSGQAYNKLKMLVKTSNGDLSKLERLESIYG
jgi:anthranilate phosphoribosyltransferase